MDAITDPNQRNRERQRRFRENQKAGLIGVSFLTDEINLVEGLVAAGLLSYDRTDNRAAINDATARLVELTLLSGRAPLRELP